MAAPPPPLPPSRAVFCPELSTLANPLEDVKRGSNITVAVVLQGGGSGGKRDSNAKNAVGSEQVASVLDATIDRIVEERHRCTRPEPWFFLNGTLYTVHCSSEQRLENIRHHISDDHGRLLQSDHYAIILLFNSPISDSQLIAGHSHTPPSSRPELEPSMAVLSLQNSEEPDQSHPVLPDGESAVDSGISIPLTESFLLSKPTRRPLFRRTAVAQIQIDCVEASPCDLNEAVLEAITALVEDVDRRAVVLRREDEAVAAAPSHRESALRRLFKGGGNRSRSRSPPPGEPLMSPARAAEVRRDVERVAFLNGLQRLME